MSITADIDVPQGGAEGVIVGEGGRFYGYALYMLKGKPVFTYNLLDLKRTRFEGTEALAPGEQDANTHAGRGSRGPRPDLSEQDDQLKLQKAAAIAKG